MTLGVHAYAFATVDIGNPFLQFLQFEALKAKFGVKHDLGLKPMLAQATDPEGASSFGLSLEASAGAGEGVDVIKDLLEIEFLTLELTWDQPLAHSPQGSLAITPATVKTGDDTQLGQMATFTVTLDSSTFLGIESVEGVEIKWLKNGSLEPGRPGCASLATTPGQTVFSCQTDFLQEHLGDQTFYAFLKASLFGVPLPIPLEVADDSNAHVTVEGGTGGVRLVERIHRAVLTYDVYAANNSNIHHEAHQVQYTGAADSLAAYNDSSDPAEHTETEGSTTGSVDGAIQQSASFTSDGNGNILSITQSGSFQAEARLTEGGELCCVNAEGDFGNTKNYITFEVVGNPVAYTLTGNIGVSSNYYRTSIGFVELSGSGKTTPVFFRVCSGQDDLYNPGTDLCAGDLGTIPPTTNISSSGVLLPGDYTLMVRPGGQAGVERTEVQGAERVQQASGSYNMTLTFSPAP